MNNTSTTGMYDAADSAAIYRNFLDWLYATFDEDEAQFRQSLIARLRLKKGQRVLVTGCGLGDDVLALLDAFGSDCNIVASDLSTEMMAGTARALEGRSTDERMVVELQACDACQLPWADDTFDAAFHFGGINLFDDPGKGVAEMARVVKEGGRVVFGDEGVAPWLKETDYGRMVVANNPLWSADNLIAKLPFSAVNVNLSWVLGNCFYMIEFDKRTQGPKINPDVRHKGWKGGSMRTRHLGRVEGITPELKDRLQAFARKSGISVHDLLESAVNEKLTAQGG
ncbi:MAG: methyltransferase domain-containing protein [Pseudomonadota bacterium]